MSNRYATAPQADPGLATVSPAPNQFANPYAAAPPQLPTAPAASVPFAAVTAAATQPATSSTATTAAAPDARRLPPGAPPLGFDGYCPVTMRNQWKWVAGDPQWGIVHRGRTYWFVGQQEQQQFWENPDHYSPALSGIDPVLAIDHKQQVPGKRQHSLDYDNLFYLFSSEATLQQFAANPERYAASVRQAMGIERGRIVLK
jgi:protein disulfide-isomerase